MRSKTGVKWNKILDCMLFHVINKHTHETQTNTCTIYIAYVSISLFFLPFLLVFKGKGVAG